MKALNYQFKFFFQEILSSIKAHTWKITSNLNFDANHHCWDQPLVSALISLIQPFCSYFWFSRDGFEADLKFSEISRYFCKGQNEVRLNLGWNLLLHIKVNISAGLIKRSLENDSKVVASFSKCQNLNFWALEKCRDFLTG